MLRSICERFNVGRSTALYVTRRVVKALVELAPAIIKWPTGARLDEVQTGFENTSGFPKIIGAVDGTHINIPTPKKYPECYVNRKGHHSIQLQVYFLFYSLNVSYYISCNLFILMFLFCLGYL